MCLYSVANSALAFPRIHFLLITPDDWAKMQQKGSDGNNEHEIQHDKYTPYIEDSRIIRYMMQYAYKHVSQAFYDSMKQNEDKVPKEYDW